MHALGVRQTVVRKLIRRGQRIVMARLHLGAAERVLGVSASAIAGRVVALEDLWGDAATRQLSDRLATARDTASAAAVLEETISRRVASTQCLPVVDGSGARLKLARSAADKLTRANVSAVAVDLGVSDRHLRRVFHEAVGVSPKAFARLTRFDRAVRAARADARASWANIATAAGYYDQAHLIAEFRAIAGATPCALLRELRAGPSLV